MGTLFSLSKSATSIALDTSEVVLLLFGVLLTVGLIGEYAKSERWKRHVKIFEMLVIIGVAGELLADGGIFLFSSHLQTIADQEIGDLATVAHNAKGSADDAAKSARTAHDELGAVEKDIVSAKKQAADAESHLADALERAANAERETAKLKARLADRVLTDPQVDAVVAAIKPFAGQQVRVTAYATDAECRGLTAQVLLVLDKGGWKRLPATGMMLGGVTGILMYVNPKSEMAAPAVTLATVLNQQGITTTIQIDSNMTNVVEIEIGSRP